MKLLTIIVLYQPDIDILLKGILSVIDQSDEVLLYENSKLLDSEIATIYSDCGESGAEKIKFVGNGINRGISGALNFAIDWGVQYSFTHLLTMDQDSHFDLAGVENFKKIITSLIRQDIGVYSPNPVVNGKPTYERNDKGIYLEVDTITSGSIFSILLLKHFNGFDDSLFIDAVDYEFCYRIFSLEKKLSVIFPEVYLHHEFGYPTNIGFGLVSENYSAFRTYYIIRNHIVIWKRYPGLFRKEFKIGLVRNHIIGRVVKIILGEKDKWNKLASIAKGIIHGIIKK